MIAFGDTLAQVRAAQQGDRAALEALFSRYWPQVQRIVAIRIGRRSHECADIEDLAQDAMLKAFRAFDRFDTERSEGTFRHWLSRIVENAIRDLGRRTTAHKRRAAPAVPLAESTTGSFDPVAPDPRPSQVAQGRELESRIELVLLGMTERHRELILQRDRCAMSYAEVAEALGLKNADSARALHHRALRALAGALEVGG